VSRCRCEHHSPDSRDACRKPRSHLRTVTETEWWIAPQSGAQPGQSNTG
jgi:hypothetical protein